ncbi:hypothetical protein ACJJIK_01990 [Microbulbifer sp. ZKSA006]|uniref:hypothetical protein n=1 Tax=Microbulbifer sp. ZKSA006 TaxID=3243390 RepID=UPI00403A5EC9
MNPLTCHCGAIHFNRLVDSPLAAEAQGAHTDMAGRLHIRDPENSLQKYHFKEGALQERGFCKHCGAEIYAINRGGELLHQAQIEETYRPNYAGVLNYGF